MARAFQKEGVAHENASSILDEEKQEEQQLDKVAGPQRLLSSCVERDRGCGKGGTREQCVVSVVKSPPMQAQ